jgi:hypothetical protein
MARHIWIGIDMAANRDRSGLTAKETKIVSKKSRLFDSKTQGIGLPQKSSKATITGRKPGKPKPTAGKGINKNVVTKGGKAGRAIENKMRSAMNLPKLQTTGKAKAVNKASVAKTGRAAGSVNLSSKGKITEYMTGNKVKGTARKIRDTAQRVELEAKGVSKRKSLPKYGRGGMGGGGLFGGGAIRKSK